MRDSTNGWTVGTLRIHIEAKLAAEEKFQAERDRRYTEVTKAKEDGEAAARILLAETQSYKDAKAKELSEQLLTLQTALAASKEDLASMQKTITAALAPLVEYVNSQTGPARRLTAQMLVMGLGALLTILSVVAAIWALFSRAPR